MSPLQSNATQISEFLVAGLGETARRNQPWPQRLAAIAFHSMRNPEDVFTPLTSSHA